MDWTLRAFRRTPGLCEMIIVVPPRYFSRARRSVSNAGLDDVAHVIAGGSERQHSVWNGINAFERRPDIVLVHDAVRPLVSRRMIGEVSRAAARYRAAVAGVRVKETIKVEKRRGFFTLTLQRDRLWVVQTPQGFRFELLHEAHLAAQKAGFLGTDEASLVERLGVPVRIVEGDYHNIKITTREDLELARSLLKKRKY
jgi:2-C-methyl-D-erythritol 4-phosphate cytidylyltransferase